MAFYPVAGCKFFIGTPLDEKSTDFTEADFASMVWTEVSKWSQMGDLGDSSNLIPIQLIGEERDKQQKGTRSGGTMQNIFVADPTNPGQLALMAAEKTRNNYAIKIELNDKPAVGASPKNGTRMFIGLVQNANETGGAANTPRNLSINIPINSNIVRTQPSAT